jgi:hypothetical protein
VTTDLTTEEATPKPIGIRRLRARVTDVGGAAKRRLQRFRGPRVPVADVVTSEGLAAGDDGIVEAPTASQRPGIGLWRAITRAKLVVVVTLALVQVAVAVISWRVRGSRARRRGQPGEDAALEALGEKLGGLAGSVDASRDV